MLCICLHRIGSLNLNLCFGSELNSNNVACFGLSAFWSELNSDNVACFGQNAFWSELNSDNDACLFSESGLYSGLIVFVFFHRLA